MFSAKAKVAGSNNFAFGSTQLPTSTLIPSSGILNESCKYALIYYYTNNFKSLRNMFSE